jgi:tetratricopeptide (TPR) repeat protein
MTKTFQNASRKRGAIWRRSVAFGALSLAIVGVGCATTGTSSKLTYTGDALVDGQNAAERGPEKDRVLWQYRTGLTAMRRGDFAEAERQFDAALLRVGGIIGDDKAARKARGYFNEEAKKTFLGEPYERVMAYFYRGILYWMNGEPDNARACFRNAQFQDSDPENREYANDWVLMDYLDGFATAKLSGDGADALSRANQSFKMGTLPPYSKAVNTLVFLEWGQGPTKYSTGEFNEQLRIRPGHSRVQGAWLKVANKQVRIAPYDDVTFQATTRGGRVMDHILANKAVFKSATDNFGNAAILGGAVVAGSRASQEVGLGLIAAGVLSKVVAAATTPSADTRAWDNLPNYVSFLSLELPPGPHAATVEFTDAAGNVMPGLTRTFNFNVSAGSDTVLFASDRNT